MEPESHHVHAHRATLTNALPQRGAGDHRRRPRPQPRDPWLTHRRLAAVLHRRYSSNTSILASGINRDDGGHISSDAARARRFTRGRQVARVRADDLRDDLGEARRAPPRCCQREGARTSSCLLLHDNPTTMCAVYLRMRSRGDRGVRDLLMMRHHTADLGGRSQFRHNLGVYTRVRGTLFHRRAPSALPPCYRRR